MAVDKQQFLFFARQHCWHTDFWGFISSEIVKYLNLDQVVHCEQENGCTNLMSRILLDGGERPDKQLQQSSNN